MKQLPRILLLTTALTLSACGQAGEQWLNPDKTFALFDQPEVKGVDDTQEKMAKEAFDNGEYGRAAQFYQQLIASNKATPEQMLRYKLGMAEAVRRVGDNPASLAMYEEILKTAPGNVEALEGRGLTLMATGKVTDAGRAFADVMAKDTNRWRTLNALGILFVTKNMIPEAMAYYTEALNHSPDNAAVLNNVGLSHAVDRNFPRAIAALDQASRASKAPAQKKQIDMNLAMVVGVSGDMDRAREIASKYYEGAALDNNLGLYAHLAKDNALAKTYLNMALSQSPIFYERAWQNLDTIGGQTSGEDSSNATPATNLTLPAPAKLEQPATAAPLPAKPYYKSKYRKTRRPLNTLPVEPPANPAAAPVPAAAAPVMLPEVTAGDKPAGLVVGPAE